ncbi:MAG: hypothetical protein WC307_04905 [Candidatus Nanoarchaeia archaeon]
MRSLLFAATALLMLSVGFCQNNAYVTFSIYIDRASPSFDNYNASPEVINNVNETLNLSAHWTDDRNATAYTYESNVTGLFENSSETILSYNWSNTTINFSPLDEGKIIDYRLNCRDRVNNWNSTAFGTVTINSISPAYSDVEQDASVVSAGEIVKLSSYWTDNFQVSSVTLQTNETGSWLDNGSPVNINNAGDWANFTIDTTSMNGVFYWRLKGLDAVSNSNETSINYFTVN